MPPSTSHVMVDQNLASHELQSEFSQNSPSRQGEQALLDYQRQLLFLERQNKKRLLQARQEQDQLGHQALALTPMTASIMQTTSGQTYFAKLMVEITKTTFIEKWLSQSLRWWGLSGKTLESRHMDSDQVRRNLHQAGFSSAVEALNQEVSLLITVKTLDHTDCVV